MVGDRSQAPLGGGHRRRWPAGLVGMIGLVIAVEVGMARGARHIEGLSAADWGCDVEAAAREAARAEVLCFGDSLVKTGVTPAALEARLDCPTYNLAALGAPPPASYCLLRRALEAGARPRAIVVDAKASQLSGHAYRETVGDWAILLRPIEALRMSMADRDPGFFGLYLGPPYLMPSLRLRHDVRKAVLDQMAGRPRAPEATWRPVIDRQYAVNGGAVLFAPGHPKDGPDPWPGGAVPPGEAGVCYPAWWSAYPTNLIYFDRFLALARSREIPVFLLIPPIHPGVQAERERRGLDARYVTLMRKVRDKYENVVVVDGRHAGFGHGACSDGRHLNLEGATALSHALAEVIAARLDGRAGGDRWVSLPRFARPTVRLAIEDLDESKANVTRRLARR